MFHAVLERLDSPLNETVGGRMIWRISHMTDSILFQELCVALSETITSGKPKRRGRVGGINL